MDILVSNLQSLRQNQEILFYVQQDKRHHHHLHLLKQHFSCPVLWLEIIRW